MEHVAFWRCSALCRGMRRGFIGSLLCTTALFAFSDGQTFAGQDAALVQTRQVASSLTAPPSGQSDGTILEGVTVDGIEVLSVNNQWVVAGRLIVVTFDQYQYLELAPIFLDLGVVAVDEGGPKEMVASVERDAAAMKAMLVALQGLDAVERVIFDSNVILPAGLAEAMYAKGGGVDEPVSVDAFIYLAGGGLAAAVAGVALMTRRRSPDTAVVEPA